MIDFETLENKVCPQCNISNDHDALFCEDCGIQISYVPTLSRNSNVTRYQAPNGRDSIMPQPYADELEAAAQQLVSLREEFNRIRAKLKHGSIVWKKVLRHRDAWELEEKFGNALDWILDIFIEGSIKQVQQRLDHQYRYEEFLFEEGLMLARICKRIDMLAIAGDYLKKRFLDEGRFEGVEPAIAQDLLFRYLHELEKPILTFHDDDNYTYYDENDGYDDHDSLNYLENY